MRLISPIYVQRRFTRIQNSNKEKISLRIIGVHNMATITTMRNAKALNRRGDKSYKCEILKINERYHVRSPHRQMDL